MTRDNYSEQAARKNFTKREGSHFFAYYLEKQEEKFVAKEARGTGIFHAFFHLTQNFLPGTKTREAQRFWERVNFSKEKVIKQLFSVLGNFSHFFPLSREKNFRNSERVNTAFMLGLFEINSVAN
jgi:hypothetical protein